MTVPDPQPTVAALFVDPNGVYAGLPDVDVWDEARDARKYAGPWPVVAHPPCAAWSRVAAWREAMFGHRRGDDGSCFESALSSVHRFGGVLEQPACSAAWSKFGLPRPSVFEGWTGSIDGGWSCVVEQGWYGHPSAKKTWLYAHGVELLDLRWGTGFNGRRLDSMSSRDPWRSRTPVEFRDVLLAMARTAGRVPA